MFCFCLAPAHGYISPLYFYNFRLWTHVLGNLIHGKNQGLNLWHILLEKNCWLCQDKFPCHLSLLISGFFFYSTFLLKLQPFKKSMLHKVVLILKSPLVQAQGPASSSDAAVKTQTSELLRLTNAPKQLWYQYQLTALVFSFFFIFIPRRPLTNKVSNTFKRSLLHYIQYF